MRIRKGHACKKRIGNRHLAIGNVLAVAEGFEPSHGRINSAVPYQLGYATRDLYRTARGSERVKHARSAKARGFLRTLEATKGVEPLSFGLQDRRSVIQLSYIAGFGGAERS